MNTLKVILIRHGKTKGNLEKRYVGTTDEPLLLTEQNIIKKLQDKSCYGKPGHIYVSSMKRCTATALCLYGGYSGKIMTLVSEFRECDFGKWEYKNYKELSGEPAYQQWIDSSGTMDFPEGESLEAFKKRCVMAMENVIKEAFQKGYEEISCVVHGGTIMSVMEHFAVPKQEYFQWQTENLAGYSCIVSKTEASFTFTKAEKIPSPAFDTPVR